MADTEESLTTKELAQRWRREPSTLRNWRHQGKGPKYIKPSGKYGPAVYRLCDVEEYERNNTVGGDE